MISVVGIHFECQFGDDFEIRIRYYHPRHRRHQFNEVVERQIFNKANW